MMGSIKVFDCEISIHGAAVVVQREPLCPRCMSDGEVDAQIKLLKDDLDAVAVRMKAAIQKDAFQPLRLV